MTLTAIAGQPPRWYRSVVGMTNPFVGPVVQHLGLTRVGWSARGFDGVDCTPAQVLARVQALAEAQRDLPQPACVGRLIALPPARA